MVYRSLCSLAGDSHITHMYASPQSYSVHQPYTLIGRKATQV